MSTEFTSPERLTTAQILTSNILPTYAFGDFLIGYRPDPSTQNLSKSVASTVKGDAYPSDEGGARVVRSGDGSSTLVPASGTPVSLNVFRRPELVPVNNPGQPLGPGLNDAGAAECSVCVATKMRLVEIAAVVLVIFVGYQVFFKR